MRSAIVVVLLLVCACNTLQNAAAKDPMKCERDPKCAQMNAKDRDCATQCSDDPACMDRCRQTQVDTLGHP